MHGHQLGRRERCPPRFFPSVRARRGSEAKQVGIQGVINDNYFCRSPRTGLAGSWVMAAACETARFPCGGRVGHECTGSAIARESDVRKDIGGSGGGGRDERADGAHVAARGVAVDGEGAADVADAGGPVRRCVGVGGRAAAGGGYGGTAAGADAVHVLCRRHPGRFQAGQLRTLQRRVRDWRVQYGPDREVYFEQVAVPGREAAFDFTDASDLGVTIRGVAFPHLLFEWVLSYSTWTYVGLALSETFEALVSGLQGALWMLGAVPAVLRHDNLSAATHELKRSGGRQLTARFQQVMDHYGLRSSRIQPGKPHENGVAEQAHVRTKTAIEQALLLRGDRDFADESAYLRFVRAVLDEERNRPAAARLAEERLYLQPLPTARIPEYTTFQCRVRKWSTIRIGSRIYSVPSRLIGHTVEARQHPSTVEVLYGGRVLCTMPRLRGAADHRIDYRHIIGSLVRKPGAFARYRFREELFPSLTFRAAYDALGRTHGERADVEYVRLLHLAATTSERQVEATLRARLDAGDTCAYASVQAEVRPPVPTVPVVHIPRPDLAQYDALLTGGLHG